MEELRDDVRAGQDDRLAAVDLGDLGDQRVDRVGGDQVAAVGVGPDASSAATVRLRGRARRRSGILALHLGDLGLVDQQRRGGHRSPAASEPIADSTRAAASSTGSSTW